MGAVLAKLGFKPGMTGCAIGRPDALADLLPLPSGPADDADLTIAFVTGSADVEPLAARLLPAHRPGARLWFAYPKKSGAICSDMSRDTGWQPLAARDFLPVTQVAIDADWSALRFRPRAEIPRLTRQSEIGAQ